MRFTGYFPEIRHQSELESYFVDVTDHLVERVMGSDGDDSNLDAQPGGPAR